MKSVRFIDRADKALNLQVHDNATIDDVLVAGGVASIPGLVLSQNGRPARGSDIVKDQSLVMRLPRAAHG